MKRIMMLTAIAMVAFGYVGAQKKGAKKAARTAAVETIIIGDGAPVDVSTLMTAFLIRHPEIAGSADLLQAMGNAPIAGATDTCAFVSAGEHYLQGATWQRTNGHLLVGMVSNLRDVKFYDYNPSTQVMTADRAVGVPITSILGGDWTISFNTDGYHCSVVRLTGYGTYFNFNGEKFIVAKQDLGETPTW